MNPNYCNRFTVSVSSTKDEVLYQLWARVPALDAKGNVIGENMTEPVVVAMSANIAKEMLEITQRMLSDE